MSITLKLSGKESTLHARFFPPLILEQDSEMCLLSLIAWNSISNVDESNQNFYYDDKKIQIPTGCYELEDINTFLKRELRMEHLNSPLTDDDKIKMDNEALTLYGNRHTLMAEITSRYSVDFTKPNNIGTILRFTGIKTEPFVRAISNRPVKILKVQVYQVSCNLITNSYEGDRESHVIYEFFPSVAPGYKINQVPNQLIYYHLPSRLIHEIEVRLTDQDDNLLNFRGEVIHLRLHIRPRANANNI